MKRELILICFFTMLIIFTGCKTEEIDSNYLIETSSDVENTLENSKELETEIVEEISEPNEVLVYDETIELKTKFNDGASIDFFFEEDAKNIEDLPNLKYIKFKDIGISEEYPEIRFEIKSENRFIPYFMQNHFNSISNEYKKQYGLSWLYFGYDSIYGMGSDEGGYGKFPDYVPSWLRDYTIKDCPQVDFKRPYPVEKNKDYTLEGSCLAYNPNWETQGILIGNFWNYLDNENQDIKVRIKLYKVKGETFPTYEDEFIHESIIQDCPPKTNKCDYTWTYKSSNGREVYDEDYNLLGNVHNYYCSQYINPEDQQAYWWNEWCWEKQEICNDFKDNDDDGLMDCKDFDCSEDVYCK
jgi:hypothetical protein